MSYLPHQPLNAEVALAHIHANLAIAKNDIGGFFIPGVVNTLGNMVPGEGYLLYVNKLDTLIYPSGPNLAKIADPLVVTHCSKPAHFQVVPPQATIIALSSLRLKSTDNCPRPALRLVYLLRVVFVLAAVSG